MNVWTSHYGLCQGTILVPTYALRCMSFESTYMLLPPLHSIWARILSTTEYRISQGEKTLHKFICDIFPYLLRPRSVLDKKRALTFKHVLKCVPNPNESVITKLRMNKAILSDSLGWLHVVFLMSNGGHVLSSCLISFGRRLKNQNACTSHHSLLSKNASLLPCQAIELVPHIHSH